MKRGPAQIGGAMTRLLNALTWGDGRTSFSARCGYALYRGKSWARLVVPVVDVLLQSRMHCVEQAQEAGLVPRDWP